VVLASVPPVYQRLFAESGKSVCVLGEVAPGLALPFLNVDQSAAVRHATFRLLRHGVQEVVLVHIDADTAGIRSALKSFRAACAAWPKQRVLGHLVGTTLDAASLATVARRLGGGVRDKTGYIVLAPVPVGLVVTALMHHGISIPRQAEVAALFHPAEAVKLHPPPMYYPFPADKIVRQLTDVTAQFFDTGRVPDVKKTISPNAEGD
jgi:DNA-binding LacI/PurR family transcriptional regulator